MSMCVLKRGDLRENEARFLYQNEVNLRDRETKWPPTSILHRKPNANTKLDLRSYIVDTMEETYLHDFEC